MKILVNATILSQNNTGLGVYSYNVLKNICPMFDSSQIEYDILCQSKAFLPEHCRSHALEIEYSGFISRNIAINRIGKLPYDLIWSTTQHGMLSTKSKQIITIHDLTPIIYPKGRMHQMLYYKFVLPKIVRKSHAIITVSENTKNDILKYYKKNCRSENIKVAYCGINKHIVGDLDFEILENKYGLKKYCYFSILGIHYYYKNLHSIIEAFKLDDSIRKYKVVIIGNDKCKYGKYLKQLIDKYGLQEFFVFTGFIDAEVKNAIIHYSHASIYPSLYEGFGLPVLESMQLETPVLCSNVSSLPEVGGNAALYFDPYDVRDIIDKIKEISFSEALREEMIERGKQNVAQFSWEYVAVKVFDVITKELGKQ